jgi:hypothetical protein
MTGPRDPQRELVGTNRRELTALTAGILRLAGITSPDELPNAEAVCLARETPFSAADWEHALNCIGNRPHREALISVVAQMAAYSHITPLAAAEELIGDGIRPGLLSPHIPPPPEGNIST